MIDYRRLIRPGVRHLQFGFVYQQGQEIFFFFLVSAIPGGLERVLSVVQVFW